MPNPNPSPLTRFKPGEAWTGNPGGRPKGESFTAVLRELLDQEHPRAPNWRMAAAARILQLAADGNLDALKWIAEKTEGKVKEIVEQSGEVKHVVEVTYSRRAHKPDPAGAPPEPRTDQG